MLRAISEAGIQRPASPHRASYLVESPQAVAFSCDIYLWIDIAVDRPGLMPDPDEVHPAAR